MAAISRKTPVPTSQNPVARQAEDLLWKFQLRKEHSQLLARLNAHQEQFSTFVSETRSNCQKLHARLDAVEKKVDKLEADDKKLDQESSKLHNELQALKEKVGSIAEYAQRTTSNTSKNQAIAEKVSASYRQTLHSSAEPMKNTNISKSDMLLSSNPIPRISSNDTEALPKEASEAMRPHTRMAAKRKQAASSDLANAKPSEPLRQGTSTLKEYLLIGDRAVASFPSGPALPFKETGFVETFLDGLTNDKERETLVTILQQKDLLTRISSGDQEVILVRWLSFKEAVRRSKLLETTHNMESRAISKVVEPVKTLGSAKNISNGSEITKKEMGPRQKKKRSLY